MNVEAPPQSARASDGQPLYQPPEDGEAMSAGYESSGDTDSLGSVGDLLGERAAQWDTDRDDWEEGPQPQPPAKRARSAQWCAAGPDFSMCMPVVLENGVNQGDNGVKTGWLRVPVLRPLPNEVTYLFSSTQQHPLSFHALLCRPMGGKRRGDVDPERQVAKRSAKRKAEPGSEAQEVFNVNDYSTGYELIPWDKISIDRDLTHGQVHPLSPCPHK